MPNSTLFSLEQETLTPAADRREPVLWLRRLVILSSLDSSALIREIEFRRGLNIIRTRQMNGSDAKVAGHSVGKTLLMRLIRYTVGEPHFGTAELEESVEAVLKTGYVVGHWSVSGKSWIVVRAIPTADVSDSFAARGDDWRSVVDGPKRELSHREFVKEVSEAVLSDLPEFTLQRGRKANWLDVLAWLARDYQCGYRKANDWRHQDAHSGPSLDLKENSTVMQWLMGLMSAEEMELRAKHRQLLDDQAEKKRAFEQAERKLDALRPSLWEKLELKDDAEIADRQATFDSIKPGNLVEGKIASLERLKNERAAESRVSQLESERDAAYDLVNNAESEIRSCRNLITFIERQIQEYERDPLRAYSKCQAEPCWIKVRAKETAADLSVDDHLSDLRTQLDAENEKLSAVQQQKQSLQSSLSGAIKRLKSEQDRLATERSRIDELIGQWKSFRKDAQVVQDVAASATRSKRGLSKADGEINSSLDQQEFVRSRDRERLDRLSDVYQQVLQRIFGGDASGHIQVDANGLKPVPDRRLAPEGAALSVMTMVLAFDFACVAGSIAGLGHHPRLLLHDSPREGDMEGPLFSRLFEVVHDLESRFPDSEDVSFQYIMTTTTPPPSQFADEAGPYVRLTLDARNDEDRLLRVAF